MRKTGFWIAVIALILLISAAALFVLAGGKQGGTAIVRHDGKVLETIGLDAVKESYTFAVEGKNGAHNEITVENGRIRVSAANCPDQVCVRQGWISSSGIPIVCLPHGLVIEIVEGEEGPDAVLK